MALMLWWIGVFVVCLLEEILTIRFSSLVLCFSHVWWGSSLLVGVLFAAILYRREQDKRWAEMGELLDIVDEATIVLHEQNRKDLAVNIKRAETLVKKYRRYGL